LSLDEQGFIDLSRIEKKDYTKALLIGNPFPSTAVPSDLPLTTADRQAAIRRFIDVLSALRSENSSSVTVLLGDYGAGKSHLLKLFKVSVNKKLLVTAKPSLAVYVKSPGRSMRDLFLYLIDDLGRELLTDLASKWIFDFLSKANPQRYLAPKQQWKLRDPSDIPEFLNNSQVINLIDDVRPTLGEVRHSDLVRAFLLLPHPDYSAIAWRWFVGSSISRNDKQLLNIESTVDDQAIAEQALVSILKLLHALGISGVVMLVDELEAVTLLTRLPRGLYQDSLRHLIDNNPSDLAMIFAITPEGWKELTEVPSALERRLSGSVIDLAPFVRNEVRELMQRYLLSARMKDFDKKISDIEGRISTIDRSIYPFTPGSEDAIFEATKGTPSKVVTLCRLCIENLVTSDQDTIDPEFVKSVISREGFR
jgi:type II secretory pathway predicted ATPase ExeA